MKASSRRLRRTFAIGTGLVCAVTLLGFSSVANASASDSSKGDKAKVAHVDKAKTKKEASLDKKGDDTERNAGSGSPHKPSAGRQEGRGDKLADTPSGKGDGANHHVNSPTPGKGTATGNPLCFNNGKGNDSPVGNAHKCDCNPTKRPVVVIKNESEAKTAVTSKPVTPAANVKALTPTASTAGSTTTTPATPVTTVVAASPATKAPGAATAPATKGALAFTGASSNILTGVALAMTILGLAFTGVLHFRRHRAAAMQTASGEA